MATDPKKLAAAQLAIDPMFAYLAPEQQLHAAIAALKRISGEDPDPMEAVAVVKAARGDQPPPSQLTPETVIYQGRDPRPSLAPPSESRILSDILEAVPYTHRFLGDVLGCSRQMVSMIVSQRAEERLTSDQRKRLAAVLKETKRRIDALLPKVEPNR